MLYFFAIIGFSNCFFTLLGIIKYCTILIRNKIRVKRILKDVNLDSLNEMIVNLPDKVDSKESYNELLKFCAFMLKTFPNGTLKSVNDRLLKNIEKGLAIKLTNLFKTCDSYVNLILEGINDRVQACVKGEFYMTHKGCEDIKAYMIRFKKELLIIDTYEESFNKANKNY